MAENTQITSLLEQADAGGSGLYEQLMPLVYDELKRLAHHHLRRERSGHTLNTTALVHEAYEKLVGQRTSWSNGSHFFAVASMAMRRILVNYARDRARLKRGGGVSLVSLSGVPDHMLEVQAVEITALDEALDRLSHINERAARIIECRFFGGLTIDETAHALGLSATTVKHHWRLAKTWLRSELSYPEAPKELP